MTTNLNILDQYVLCLQGTASKILELNLGSRDFPSMTVAASAMAPRVRQAFVRMEDMGLSGALRWIRQVSHKHSRDNSY